MPKHHKPKGNVPPPPPPPLLVGIESSITTSHIQSNLGITTTEGTRSKWSYFSGGLICQVWFKIFQYGVVCPCASHDISDRWLPHVSGGVIGNDGACKRDDRSFGVPPKEKLDKQESAFRSI